MPIWIIVKLQADLLSCGGTNSTLKISNSTIAEGTEKIQISGTNNKLYIGKGCNFTSADTSNPAAIEMTDEVYTK